HAGSSEVLAGPKTRKGRKGPGRPVPDCASRGEAASTMPSTPPAGTPTTRAAQNPRMRLHLALRAKILLFTVLPVAALVGGALWMVNRTISRQVQYGIRASLLRSSAVLESMLSSESRQLSIHGRVIARDPHFLSVFELPNLHGS